MKPSLLLLLFIPVLSWAKIVTYTYATLSNVVISFDPATGDYEHRLVIPPDYPSYTLKYTCSYDEDSYTLDVEVPDDPPPEEEVEHEEGEGEGDEKVKFETSIKWSVKGSGAIIDGSATEDVVTIRFSEGNTEDVELKVVVTVECTAGNGVGTEESSTFIIYSPVWDTYHDIGMYVGGATVSPGIRKAVALGGSLACSVTPSSSWEYDRRQSASITTPLDAIVSSGSPYWQCSSGSFQSSGIGTSVTWLAPETPAQGVSLKVFFDDVPCPKPENEAGTTDDGPAEAGEVIVDVVKIDRLECEEVTSKTNNPGDNETVYLPVGFNEGAVTVNAIPDPTGGWPYGKPAWSGDIQSSSGGTATVDTTPTGIKTVAAECGNTMAIKICVLEVKSLKPEVGEEIDDEDDDPDTKTFLVAVAETGVLTVNATPNPDVAEENLPDGWSLTGGTGTGKLSRTIDRTKPDIYELTCTCGTSEKTTKVIIFKVELTNIKFNHDTGSSASDAINIRQKYSTPYDISNGEWISGGVNLPACYTANKSVTVKARFTVEPVDITSADIWAISTDSDGSLGDVVNANVIFSDGVSSPEYVTFQVSGKTPNCVKKTTTDMWQWKLGNVNNSGSTTCDLNSSGNHTVYTILNEPATPWVNTAGSQKNAWTTALDFTIVNASCNGDSTALSALTHITQYLHTSHGLTYDIYGGAPAYASSSLGGTFNLTGYIDKTGGNTINCYDQASGVCTLGRLIGVSVTYRFMQPFGYINTVNLVGEGNCNNPFYPLSSSRLKIAGMDDVEPVRIGFLNHAFAVYEGLVFDACAGPETGARTEPQYLSHTVDCSTAAEAGQAGSISDIFSGVLNAIY